MARRSGEPWPLVASLRAYQLLLGLYPAPFRRCWGGERAQLFGDLGAQAWRRRGLRGLAALWATTLADLTATLPREHLARVTRPRRRVRRRYQLAAERMGSAPDANTPLFRIARTCMWLLKLLWRWLFGVRPRPAPRSGPRPQAGEIAGRPRFDKFTERARKVMNLAQDEAKRFHHNYIGTEHLLLGLVREGDGVAAQVLRGMGVELTKVRSAVEFIIGHGDHLVLGEVGLTPRAKKVIELAVDESRRMGHHYIGTEHLLLGMVREGEGIAAGVLQSLNVRLDRVRAETLRVLGETRRDPGNAGGPPDPPPPDPPPPDQPPDMTPPGV